MTAPLGCQHCGAEKREHCQRWHPSVGFHGWTEPTRDQIRDRLRIRLAARSAQATKLGERTDR